MRTRCRLLPVALALGTFIVTPSVGAADSLPTVAIIGTGDMGDSLGPRFAELGYIASGWRITSCASPTRTILQRCRRPGDRRNAVRAPEGRGRFK